MTKATFTTDVIIRAYNYARSGLMRTNTKQQLDGVEALYETLAGTFLDTSDIVANRALLKQAMEDQFPALAEVAFDGFGFQEATTQDFIADNTAQLDTWFAEHATKAGLTADEYEVTEAGADLKEQIQAAVSTVTPRQLLELVLERRYGELLTDTNTVELKERLLQRMLGNKLPKDQLEVGLKSYDFERAIEKAFPENARMSQYGAIHYGDLGDALRTAYNEAMYETGDRTVAGEALKTAFKAEFEKILAKMGDAPIQVPAFDAKTLEGFDQHMLEHTVLNKPFHWRRQDVRSRNSYSGTDILRAYVQVKEKAQCFNSNDDQAYFDVYGAINFLMGSNGSHFIDVLDDDNLEARQVLQRGFELAFPQLKDVDLSEVKALQAKAAAGELDFHGLNEALSVWTEKTAGEVFKPAVEPTVEVAQDADAEAEVKAEAPLADSTEAPEVVETTAAEAPVAGTTETDVTEAAGDEQTNTEVVSTEDDTAEVATVAAPEAPRYSIPAMPAEMQRELDAAFCKTRLFKENFARPWRDGCPLNTTAESIEFDTSAGRDIHDQARQTIKLATITGKPVSFEFNGVTITVTTQSTPEQAYADLRAGYAKQSEERKAEPDYEEKVAQREAENDSERSDLKVINDEIEASGVQIKVRDDRGWKRVSDLNAYTSLSSRDANGEFNYDDAAKTQALKMARFLQMEMDKGVALDEQLWARTEKFIGSDGGHSGHSFGWVRNHVIMNWEHGDALAIATGYTDPVPAFPVAGLTFDTIAEKALEEVTETGANLTFAYADVKVTVQNGMTIDDVKEAYRLQAHEIAKKNGIYKNDVDVMVEATFEEGFDYQKVEMKEWLTEGYVKHAQAKRMAELYALMDSRDEEPAVPVSEKFGLLAKATDAITAANDTQADQVIQLEEDFAVVVKPGFELSDVFGALEAAAVEFMRKEAAELRDDEEAEPDAAEVAETNAEIEKAINGFYENEGIDRKFSLLAAKPADAAVVDTAAEVDTTVAEVDGADVDGTVVESVPAAEQEGDTTQAPAANDDVAQPVRQPKGPKTPGL